jgi:hypothetical protein
MNNQGLDYVFVCQGIYSGDYSISFPSLTTLFSTNFGDIGFNLGSGGAYFVNGTLGVASGGVITVLSTPNIIYGLFSTSGTTTFALSSSFSGRYFIGNIQEVLVYTGPITTLQRQQVEGYLAWKWGLQANLPSNHPYKNTSAVFVTQPTTLAALGVNPYNSMFISNYFNPRSISGLQLWLDAADSTTVGMSGTRVISWSDKSVNAYTVIQSSLSLG